MHKNQTAVGIDIGTTRVRVVVGALGEDDTVPTIVGAGSFKNRGVRKGVINNVEDTMHAIHMALEEAERVSGQQVSSASVSVNGSHIVGLNSKGVIAISTNAHEITYDDIDRVEEDATVVQLPPNREILQVFAKSFNLDGQENIKDPIGMSGRRLEVDAHIVTAGSPPVRNIDKTFDGLNLRINHHIVAGLAAAEAVLDETQKESGTVVVDLGASTTNIIVFDEEEVEHVAVLPVGSINITNDLAIGLRTDLDIAEEVKVEHARAARTSEHSEPIIIKRDEQEDLTFHHRDVDSIVKARLEETFELINKELKKINKAGRLPGGIVLVGGGAQMPGIDDFAKKHLELPARVSKPRNFSGIIDTVNAPDYATAVGLMMLDFTLAGISNNRSSGSKLSPGSAISGVKGIIKKFLP